MNKKGFTLIELLAVIVVLGIVAVIATSLVVHYMRNAKIDAFAVEASNIITGAKNAVSMNELNKLEVDNDDNSCKIGNRMCFTIDKLIELGIYEGNKDVYEGKVNIDISDKNNLKYKLFLEKENEFNIVDSNITDYSKNRDVINSGGFSGEDIEEYSICSCVEDTTSPVIEKFYIEEEEQEYLTKRDTKLYISWLDTDVKYYCITDINNSNNCEWVEVTGNNVEVDYTFDSDGEKKLYAFIKDKKKNVSDSMEDSIIIDTEAPSENDVIINDGAMSTNSTNVTLTLSSSGATEICISNSTSCSDWEDYTTSKEWALTEEDGTKTVYVWYRDEAGNTTTSYVTDTIILDTVAPTVTASASSNNTSSPKISITSDEAGTYCVNKTSTSTNFSNCTLTGSISADTTITTSALSSTGTYYVHVKDSAGNVGGSSAVSITYSNPFGTYLQSAKTTGFNSIMEGGLYRYQGTSVDNYVCFGTTSKSTCTGNTDRYMYRIVGVNSSGQVKLIKKEALNSTVQWYSDASQNITWPNSAIYSSINGSSFLTNTTYVPSGWSSKIATTSWKYGATTSATYTASDMYGIENSFTSTISAKIGLIYIHDFYYSPQTGGVTCLISHSSCGSSWMHMTNCDSGASSKTEWTMTRSWYSDVWEEYLAWNVNGGTAGMVYGDHPLEAFNSVRPVFYLTTSVKYISGSGKASDPFIIS